MHTYMYTYKHIYIYIERERDVYLYIYVYIYIYIYTCIGPLPLRGLPAPQAGQREESGGREHGDQRFQDTVFTFLRFMS